VEPPRKILTKEYNIWLHQTLEREARAAKCNNVAITDAHLTTVYMTPYITVLVFTSWSPSTEDQFLHRWISSNEAQETTTL
jgi:hypothetical protein